MIIPDIALGGGQYFVVGDNRTNSNDSRMIDTYGIGFVNRADIKGKIMWSWSRTKIEPRF